MIRNIIGFTTSCLGLGLLLVSLGAVAVMPANVEPVIFAGSWVVGVAAFVGGLCLAD